MTKDEKLESSENGWKTVWRRESTASRSDDSGRGREGTTVDGEWRGRLWMGEGGDGTV